MFGSFCFHSSLTQELSHKLELQQRRSLAVILGSQYRNYRHALSLTSLPRLDTLREEACLKWALRAQENPLHTDIFPLNNSQVNTRYRSKFREYLCFSSKYYNSAVPYMTRALNQHQNRNLNNTMTTNSGVVIQLWISHNTPSVAVNDGNWSSFLAKSPEMLLITVFYNKHHYYNIL